jgi:mono/diheme cytochrome c family protein
LNARPILDEFHDESGGPAGLGRRGSGVHSLQEKRVVVAGLFGFPAATNACPRRPPVTPLLPLTTMSRLATLLALTVLPLHAQDGAQLFSLYCAACHGADGKGATGGQFPPLAGSPWVTGDAARAIKVVLHGLHGEVEVDGRLFNLEMPPQGGVIADDQIAAILTHIRGSWGNEALPVTAELVKSTRSATADRTMPWTAGELLKLHPLPSSAPSIANLLSQTYQGEWKSLPDFSKLEANNIEEEHDGILSLRRTGLTDHFAMVWQGDLTAPEGGEFVFRLDADDAARVVIDNREVVTIDGIGAMDGSRTKQGKVQLDAGDHRLRVEYVEFEGQQGIALAWKGPGIPSWRNLSQSSPRPPHEPILVTTRNGRAVLYRNFIEGTTQRAIGVGFPGGVNLAYSADHLAPGLIWTGDFMDASRHWRERGQGDQPPAGDHVVTLADARALPAEARFRGYLLDPAGNPTFLVQIGEQILRDSWSPAGPEGAPALIRTLELKDSGPVLEIPLSGQLNPLSESEWTLEGALSITVEGASIETRCGSFALVLSPNQPATLIYRWK